VDFEFTRMELMHARRIYHRNPKWRLVDVTNKPIEEIASEILASLPRPRRLQKRTSPLSAGPQPE
jgi:regulator of PEP synthase PpsR (kinase-PPPase family)